MDDEKRVEQGISRETDIIEQNKADDFESKELSEENMNAGSEQADINNDLHSRDSEIQEEKHTDETEDNKVFVCKKCGAKIDDQFDYCPKCGTPKYLKCGNCGTILQDGQDFCPKCGTKFQNSVVTEPQMETNYTVSNKNSRKAFVIGICAAAAIVLVLLTVFVFNRPAVEKIVLDEENIELMEEDTINAYYTITPENARTDQISWESSDETVATVDENGTITAIGKGTCTVSVYADKKKDSLNVQVKSLLDNYLETGNYSKAYESAVTDNEKLSIKAENIAAVQSAYSASNLKDPSSFVLREAYYDDENKRLVLNISGNNSYGASVSSYWLYTWSEEDQKWSYFCSVSDLTEEEFESYDDEDDKLEKVLNNLGRTLIKSTVADGFELGKDAVKRINAMFENDTLDSVELIDFSTMSTAV